MAVAPAGEVRRPAPRVAPPLPPLGVTRAQSFPSLSRTGPAVEGHSAAMAGGGRGLGCPRGRVGLLLVRCAVVMAVIGHQGGPGGHAASRRTAASLPVTPLLLRAPFAPGAPPATPLALRGWRCPLAPGPRPPPDHRPAVASSRDRVRPPGVLPQGGPGARRCRRGVGGRCPRTPARAGGRGGIRPGCGAPDTQPGRGQSGAWRPSPTGPPAPAPGTGHRPGAVPHRRGGHRYRPDPVGWAGPQPRPPGGPSGSSQPRPRPSCRAGSPPPPPPLTRAAGTGCGPGRCPSARASRP